LRSVSNVLKCREECREEVLVLTMEECRLWEVRVLKEKE
jgi:hypothetical protein